MLGNDRTVKTTDDPTSRRLAELMPELMALLHRDMAGETLAIVQEAGITLPQMVTLHTLRHQGAMSIGGLCEHLKLSTSATSHLVDRLYDAGLIERTEDPDDRRQKRVELAAPGRALVDRLAAVRASEMRGVLEQLGPELRASLVSLVEQIVVQLRKPTDKPTV